MKRLKLLPLALMACAQLTLAAPSTTRLWESAPEFRGPESVLYDAARERLYVSNVDGAPTDKDGKGFISILGMDGRIERLEWVSGLDAPKGLALVGERLYVADIDALVEIDVAHGQVLARHAAAGAKFLNDVTADTDGNVYVSDMATNRIYRLQDGRLEQWLESPALDNPNGLHAVGDRLYVGAWGVMGEDFATPVPGRIKTVSLGDKRVADFAGTAPVGNMDGIEVLPDGRVLATDWMAGGLMLVGPDGSRLVLDKLSPGSADLGYAPATRTVLVPMMNDGKVIAFRLSLQ